MIVSTQCSKQNDKTPLVQSILDGRRGTLQQPQRAVRSLEKTFVFSKLRDRKDRPLGVRAQTLAIREGLTEPMRGRGPCSPLGSPPRRSIPENPTRCGAGTGGNEKIRKSGSLDMLQPMVDGVKVTGCTVLTSRGRCTPRQHATASRIPARCCQHRVQ